MPGFLVSIFRMSCLKHSAVQAVRCLCTGDEQPPLPPLLALNSLPQLPADCCRPQQPGAGQQLQHRGQHVLAGRALRQQHAIAEFTCNSTGGAAKLRLLIGALIPLQLPQPFWHCPQQYVHPSTTAAVVSQTHPGSLCCTTRLQNYTEHTHRLSNPKMKREQWHNQT